MCLDQVVLRTLQVAVNSSPEPRGHVREGVRVWVWAHGELKLRNEMASPREDVQRGKEMAGEMTLEITQSAEQVRERERAGRGGKNAKEKLPGGQVLSGAAKASGTMCLPRDLKVIRSFVNRFITAWIS